MILLYVTLAILILALLDLRIGNRLFRHKVEIIEITTNTIGNNKDKSKGWIIRSKYRVFFIPLTMYYIRYDPTTNISAIIFDSHYIWDRMYVRNIKYATFLSNKKSALYAFYKLQGLCKDEIDALSALNQGVIVKSSYNKPTGKFNFDKMGELHAKLREANTE